MLQKNTIWIRFSVLVNVQITLNARGFMNLTTKSCGLRLATNIFFSEIMWISDHLMLDGRHFFRECCRSANGLWFIWVYVSKIHTLPINSKFIQCFWSIYISKLRPIFTNTKLSILQNRV